MRTFRGVKENGYWVCQHRVTLFGLFHWWEYWFVEDTEEGHPSPTLFGRPEKILTALLLTEKQFQLQV